MAPLSLEGRTIVVTRAQGQAEDLCLRLRRKGARVVEAPLIRFVDPPSFTRLDGALARLAAYDAIVFTSVNAVDRFFARARRLGLGRPAPPKKLFAVGPQTAQALRAAGWPTAVPGRRFSLACGQRALLPRALVAAADLPRWLRRHGATVLVAPAYQTVLDDAGARRLRRACASRRIDAVTFTSGSTVDRFVAQLGAAAARRLLKRAAAGSIGPITSQALRAHGLGSIVQARLPTARSLCSALELHFRGRK